MGRVTAASINDRSERSREQKPGPGAPTENIKYFLYHSDQARDKRRLSFYFLLVSTSKEYSPCGESNKGFLSSAHWRVNDCTWREHSTLFGDHTLFEDQDSQKDFKMIKRFSPFYLWNIWLDFLPVKSLVTTDFLLPCSTFLSSLTTGATLWSKLILLSEFCGWVPFVLLLPCWLLASLLKHRYSLLSTSFYKENGQEKIRKESQRSQSNGKLFTIKNVYQNRPRHLYNRNGK